MMTQEEYMDVVALRRQGWTITQIAAEVGRHPDTVAKWLRQGPPPERRQATSSTLDAAWCRRVEQLLARNRNLLGTSVYRLLAAEGCRASYPTVVRYLGQVRGVRRGATTRRAMPGAILCWSRARFCWFAPSVDLHHTMEGFVRF